jgi:hypothetical protein
MWPNAGLPDGSFYFDNQPNMLDQFLVNKSMATGDAPIKVNPGTAQILKPPAMVDLGTTQSRSRTADWAIRSIRRIFRPLPNHHDGRRGRISSQRGRCSTAWDMTSKVLTIRYV